MGLARSQMAALEGFAGFLVTDFTVNIDRNPCKSVVGAGRFEAFPSDVRLLDGRKTRIRDVHVFESKSQ
jgi:hypothetical protein